MPEPNPANLKIKAAAFIERSLGKALPNSAFDFALILSIITSLAPIITGCFGASHRVRQAIKNGDDSFIVANFRAAHKSGLSAQQSVAYAVQMKVECASATDQDIDEFIQLCEETSD